MPVHDDNLLPISTRNPSRCSRIVFSALLRHAPLQQGLVVGVVVPYLLLRVPPSVRCDLVSSARACRVWPPQSASIHLLVLPPALPHSRQRRQRPRTITALPGVRASRLSTQSRQTERTASWSTAPAPWPRLLTSIARSTAADTAARRWSLSGHGTEGAWAPASTATSSKTTSARSASQLPCVGCTRRWLTGSNQASPADTAARWKMT